MDEVKPCADEREVRNIQHSSDMVERVARPLDWRAPDPDELGHKSTLLTAPGIGGSYDICGETADGYVLWWATDPFTFQEGFATLADAQAAAEADWQKSIISALEASHAPGEE
jgi:hypothetical protein